jgi:hypothetical protein
MPPGGLSYESPLYPEGDRQLTQDRMSRWADFVVEVRFEGRVRRSEGL